jgi:hypothetical protein
VPRSTFLASRDPLPCGRRPVGGLSPERPPTEAPEARAKCLTTSRPRAACCRRPICVCGCRAGEAASAADLQAIIDAGQGDKPIKDLKFRCTKCGSRRTDFVVMSRDALAVQPWRAEGAETGAARHLRGQRPWR